MKYLAFLFAFVASGFGVAKAQSAPPQINVQIYFSYNKAEMTRHCGVNAAQAMQFAVLALRQEGYPVSLVEDYATREVTSPEIYVSLKSIGYYQDEKNIGCSISSASAVGGVFRSQPIAGLASVSNQDLAAVSEVIAQDVAFAYDKGIELFQWKKVRR